MNNLNSVIIEGNLINDPKLNHTAKDRSICEFTICSKRYFKTGACSGLVEDASDFDIICYDKPAEICYEDLKKDRSVRIVGRLQEYKQPLDTGQGGVSISRVHIIAEHVEFQSKKKHGNS